MAFLASYKTKKEHVASGNVGLLENGMAVAVLTRQARSHCTHAVATVESQECQ